MSIQSNADRAARTDVLDVRQGDAGEPEAPRSDLTWRSDHLAEALQAGAAELDPDAVAAAEGVLATVRARADLLDGHTVVALAGATGSGKSSLFNLLVGDEVSEIGPRRPTTSTAVAAVWGQEPVAELLDWLAVGRRHEVTEPDAARTPQQDVPGASLDGLVLLDLPDVDSRALEHREVADRLLGRVDVFVWVTDPQKYADSRLHEDYLRALHHHAEVMLVVLNQIDRLPGEEAIEAVTADLRGLLASGGVDGVPVLTTSARTTRGVDGLRERIAGFVADRSAAQNRLRADLARAAESVRDGVADSEPGRQSRPRGDLVDALARAAGVPIVLDAVERDHRRQAWARTGWPFVRWLRGLRPDPLRRLHLGDSTGTERNGASSLDVRRVIGRSSLPAPSPAARAAVDLAVRSSADAAAEGLPPRWAAAVHDAVDPHERSLAADLDRAVTGTPLREDSPLWWTPVSILQRLLALAAIVGAAWLLVLVVVGWLSLPNDPPTVGEFPLPALLLVGGLLLGFLLGILSRMWAQVGARRRRRRLERSLSEAIGKVARSRVDQPMQEVLDRHRRVRQHLGDLTAR